MSEIHREGDIDFDIDSKGQLVYWDCTKRRCVLLEPAKPVPDPNMIIGKVGQQNLLPTHFELKPKDLENTQISDYAGLPIGEPIRPGISAFLFFGSGKSRQDNLESISTSYLGRDITRKNRLYIALVGDIVKAGWTPVFAPLVGKVNNPLHVLIVPDKNIPNKNAIVGAFVRWEC